MDNNTLARQIYQVAKLDGSFVLRSGTISNTYFDKYRFEAQPQLLKAIADALTPLVPANTQVLAGLEMGGIPIVTMLSQLTNLPCAFIRKQAKSYGTCQYAEGTPLANQQVTLVEDVVSTGGALVDAVHKLHNDQVSVDQALCVIDRQGGGKEALATLGVTLTALFTPAAWEELTESGRQ